MSIESRRRPSLRGRWIALTLGALLAGMAWAGPSPGLKSAYAATGSQTAGVTLSARAGFDSYFKESQWTPVRVTVANDGPDVSGDLQMIVPRNGGETLFTRPVELPTQSRREVYFYIPLEGYLASLHVDLVSGQKILASADVRLSQTGPQDTLYGVLAASPTAYNSLADVKPLNGNTIVTQLDLADLPPLAAGWMSLDALVIADTDTGAFSLEQRQALADWVRQGGRLIVVGGPSWQKTAAGLGGLLPLTPTGTRTVTDLSPLATFAAASAPVGQAVAAEGQLTADAVSLSNAEGASLVAYRPDGFGWVAFAAIDPALAPFKGWDGLGGFFRSILAVSTSRPDWATGIFNWSSAEQAAKAVPGLIVPSPWEICGFLSLYIIVVGPLNYLVLRRFKHRSWAWFTIPAVVLVFSAGAYVTGYQLRGNEAVLHRLTVVEVWPGAERAQAEQIVGLFSPRRTTYAVTFEPGIVAKPLPYASFAPPNAAREVVEQADQTRLPQVRTEIGAVNVYIAQGQVPSPHFASSLTQHLGGALAKGGATLEGSLSNQSNLTLTDAVLLAPGGSQRLGSIQPGQTVNIAPLLLSTQRATPASANGTLPSSRPYIPVAAPQGALSGQDTTFTDILGTTPPSNQEEYRRNMLLSAVLDQYGGGERGNGVYLAGWTSTSPFNATISAPFRTMDLSLYLVALPYTLDLGQGTLTLPPGWMTWASLNTDKGQYTPYDTQLVPSGTMAFQFAPYQPVAYQTVHGLTLHLAGYGAGTLAAELKVELWDFTAAAWLEQPKLSWGDNGITAPARFVGPQGEILVRVTNIGGASENIQQVDFTLDVDR